MDEVYKIHGAGCSGYKCLSEQWFLKLDAAFLCKKSEVMSYS